MEKDSTVEQNYALLHISCQQGGTGCSFVSGVLFYYEV